ncbi:hypothetical protein [Ornithinibacillus californiensis]|uniref:hypothetical protein n=1 Tax=Ornithinibacillus californiensis TaxID=161536 RepID=UPI00064DA266|nr:hypothetical protein [Ornithinibacillus californiensis]
MKKMGLVVILFVLSIGLFGCQQNADQSNTDEKIDKVIIYPLGSSSDKLVIEDTETIKMIKEAIDHAVQQPGIVDMANPEFRIEIGEESYFLWIDEKSGTIMNTKDTHTIYSLTDNAIKEVNDLVKETEQN